MKSKRQEKILELIKSKVCLTQEDLQNGLLELGFDVTQSTVSRDIRELKLVKGRDSEGNYRYLANQSESKAGHSSSHYNDLFSKAVKSVNYSLNNVVIKCRSGLASGACVALDTLFHEFMLGSLAGDDTIIIVTRSTEHSKNLVEKINSIL